MFTGTTGSVSTFSLRLFNIVVDVVVNGFDVNIVVAIVFPVVLLSSILALKKEEEGKHCQQFSFPCFSSTNLVCLLYWLVRGPEQRYLQESPFWFASKDDPTGTSGPSTPLGWFWIFRLKDQNEN